MNTLKGRDFIQRPHTSKGCGRLIKAQKDGQSGQWWRQILPKVQRNHHLDQEDEEVADVRVKASKNLLSFSTFNVQFRVKECAWPTHSNLIPSDQINTFSTICGATIY